MGRHMLKKTSKLPCSVITPTSPIRTPSQRYSWGNRLFGSGNQSGYPRFGSAQVKSRAYISCSDSMFIGESVVQVLCG